MNIKWKENAVCYAGGKQWFSCNIEELISENQSILSLIEVLSLSGLQLNEPSIGDCIEKSELDTEHKYNDAVEEFGLFGCAWGESACEKYDAFKYYGEILIWSDGLHQALGSHKRKKRKLTYSQLMAIGKLKRLMNECTSSAVSKVNLDIERAVKRTINAELDKPKLATQYLNECIQVQKQRGEQYDSAGTGERSFDAAAKAYNALTGQNLKGSDVCLILTCVKAVRQYSNPDRLHEDSLLDMISYASLWAEELNKEIK